MEFLFQREIIAGVEIKSSQSEVTFASLDYHSLSRHLGEPGYIFCSSCWLYHQTTTSTLISCQLDTSRMDVNFCVHYKGDGSPPTNRFCRNCPYSHIACDALWQLVVDLSRSNNGDAVPLPGTRAVMFPNKRTTNSVRLMINCRWYLGREDFLYFIATGHAGMGRKGDRQKRIVSPSLTRQEPYVQSILLAIGGDGRAEVQAVRQIQASKTP